jgi:hypothetical protein
VCVHACVCVCLCACVCDYICVFVLMYVCMCIAEPIIRSKIAEQMESLIMEYARLLEDETIAGVLFPTLSQFLLDTCGQVSWRLFDLHNAIDQDFTIKLL